VILLRWYDFRFGFVDDTTVGIDGVPAWPHDRVRADGFDDGFTGIARPIPAFPLTVSIDSEAVTSVDAYHWYLSQRTDDASLQWLALSQSNPAQSGTVTISLTAKCVTDMGLSTTTDDMTEPLLREILKNVDLYVVRVSDYAIQWLPMLQYTLSDY
jgi:hypothetical protein